VSGRLPLAQVNIGRLKAPFGSPEIREFADTAEPRAKTRAYPE
jgi:hypothetical protein